MSYKTLIIIDNTSEMSSLNRDIIRETLKYFVTNIDKDNKVAIAVTGETAEYVTDYEDALNTQLKNIEQIEYKEVTAPGSEVLMEVILNWKEGDFAFRDILFVSAKNTASIDGYSEEELLFEVADKQYPVYTLACAQNENESAIKSLGSLSRVSGGKSVCTTDAKSDAEVEKQLSTMLMEAMEERRRLEEEKYKDEETKTDEVLVDEELTEYEETEAEEEVSIITEDVILEEENAGNIMYSPKEEGTVSKSVESFVLLAALFFVLGMIFFISIAIRSKRNRRTEESFKASLKAKDDRKKIKKAPFSEAYESETVCLNEVYNDEDSSTKLLYQTREGVEITLEDRSDPTKFFRVLVRDSIVIGRSEKTCDVVLSYDDSISLRHCELSLRDGNIYCRDLGSSNGTMINQQKVYQEIKVESGDILRIGRLSLFIQILGEGYE